MRRLHRVVQKISLEIIDSFVLNSNFCEPPCTSIRLESTWGHDGDVIFLVLVNNECKEKGFAISQHEFRILHSSSLFVSNKKFCTSIEKNIYFRDESKLGFLHGYVLFQADVLQFVLTS